MLTNINLKCQLSKTTLLKSSSTRSSRQSTLTSEESIRTGIYHDDCAYQFKHQPKSKQIILNYKFYIYEEGNSICDYNFFEKHYNSYLLSKPNEGYDVTFSINSEFLNGILVKNLKKEFMDIKEQYYSHILNELLELVAKDRLPKYILNLNSQDLLCCIKTSKLSRRDDQLFLHTAKDNRRRSILLFVIL